MIQIVERERLARLAEEEENADQASSLKAAQSASGVSGRAGTALKYALKQIGDRYVFGAAGMVTWDYSGLTMRAYQSAGVSLPHSSAAQSRLGKKVSLNALKPGDLLFFGRPVSHVGIYLGGGKMVHALPWLTLIRVFPLQLVFSELTLIVLLASFVLQQPTPSCH